MTNQIQTKVFPVNCSSLLSDKAAHEFLPPVASCLQRLAEGYEAELPLGLPDARYVPNQSQLIPVAGPRSFIMCDGAPFGFIQREFLRRLLGQAVGIAVLPLQLRNGTIPVSSRDFLLRPSLFNRNTLCIEELGRHGRI